MRQVELLAPARDLAGGMAAIDHGADAVYIGAQRFGARSAAANTTDDIRQLCRYAHGYGARVYVALNTIVYDDETDEARRLVDELATADIDGLLVQDMAVAGMARRAGLHIHASTQTDNRSAEQVRWLHSMGFSRAVLARELSIDQMSDIHAAVPHMELEAFVHGALCVSYSGQCYASHHCFGRSANRGECAQLCRMRFDLVDNDGRCLVHGRHLLSLKDMCRIDHIEAMLDAGITSLKIEGRLKDAAYVKNVTAAYSQRLDEIVSRRPGDYRRASMGRSTYTFVPDLSRTFNRGYTDYLVGTHGPCRRTDFASPLTPKAIGARIGRVTSIGERHLTADTTVTVTSGDGLCFVDGEGELQGFRVNSADGQRLWPHIMPLGLRVGTTLYRNHDHDLATLLSRQSAKRRIAVRATLTETADGYALTMTVAEPRGDHDHQPCATATIAADKQDAMTEQRTNIVRQLTKLGATVYECHEVVLPNGFARFIPAGRLAELRRRATDALDSVIAAASGASSHRSADEQATDRPTADRPAADKYHTAYPYLYNIANNDARRTYEQQGEHVGDAFELISHKPTVGEPLLMQCRHCLRRELGHCTHGDRQPVTTGSPQPWHEPLYLVMGDGRRLRLGFDCATCQMNVYGV